MARVIAFANPASRTGKTTSAARLCLELAGRGLAVLAVDADPRSELTRSFGIDTETVPMSLHDVLVAGASAAEVLLETEFGVDVLPSTPQSSIAEGLLVVRAGRESVLRAVIDDLRDRYEVIVIDCPSSLGLLTMNALAAADELLIPAAEAHPRAVAALRNAAEEIQRFVNPGLHLP